MIKVSQNMTVPIFFNRGSGLVTVNDALVVTFVRFAAAMRIIRVVTVSPLETLAGNQQGKHRHPKIPK